MISSLAFLGKQSFLHLPAGDAVVSGEDYLRGPGSERAARWLFSTMAWRSCSVLLGPTGLNVSRSSVRTRRSDRPSCRLAPLLVGRVSVFMAGLDLLFQMETFISPVVCQSFQQQI